MERPLEEVEGQEVFSADEIQEAQERAPAGATTADVMKILQNPSALGNAFSLTEEQVTNVKSLISGMGTSAAVKYLSGLFGSEISAGIGGIVAAMAAKKMFGGR